MTGSLRCVALVVLASGAGACSDAEVRPQLLVFVDTDAHVPRFGDRLRIDLLDGAGAPCSGCSRVEDVGEPGAWPASFGVVTDGLALLRVRLYSASDEGQLGDPRPGVTIDRLAALPPAPDGLEQTRVTLRTDCTGIPADLAARMTCVDLASPSVPAPLLEADGLGGGDTLVGSWAGATEVPCAGAAAADEACIRGGAYHMGSDTVGAETGPAHLVAMRPFFLDVDEVRVEELRPWLVDHPEDDMGVLRQASSPTSQARACTVPPGTSNAANDALPANCLAHAVAANYCASIGKRLPSEAEWEWAARSREADLPYPWGTTPFPRCSEVTHARRHAFNVVPNPLDTTCTFPENLDTPPPIASGRLDVSRDGVRDLGGGLSEWMADAAHTYDAPCWTARPLPASPVCSAAMPAPECDGDYVRGVTRGGSWFRSTAVGHAASRVFLGQCFIALDVGFRCARDDDGSVPPQRPTPPAAPPLPDCGSALSPLWRHPDVELGASGIAGTAYLPGFVVDDQPLTSWFAAPGTPPWIELGLPFDAEVSSVEVKGNGGPAAEGRDFRQAEIQLYDDSGTLVRADPIELTPPSANGTLDYPAPIPSVRRVRFVGVDWEEEPEYGPGLSGLHVFGRCPASAP